MKTVHRFMWRGAGALLLIAGLAGPLSAQDQPAEFQSWKVPGWTFTPGIAIGTLRDTNVAIASPDVNGHTAADTLFQIEPFGQLEFFSPRTTFTSGYRGELRRYFELTDLDTVDHRGYFLLRHRVSRRVTFAADENFAQLPTTDMLELNGLPFARVGSRYNTAGAGVEARLTKSFDLTARYEMSSVQFLQPQVALTGGIVQGVHAALTHRFNERTSAGAEYGFRWADLNDRARQFNYQDAGGVFEFRTAERTLLSVSAGLGYLVDRITDVTRTSPYARVALTHHAQRATVGASYDRSYAPSFFLGGSHQSQEARAFVDMPFSRNRLYLQETASWRRTDPIEALAPQLASVWLRSTLGYSVQRWIRLEGYHQFTSQDNRLAGGRITRHLVGGQLVISQPVRIQ